MRTRRELKRILMKDLGLTEEDLDQALEDSGVRC